MSKHLDVKMTVWGRYNLTDGHYNDIVDSLKKGYPIDLTVLPMYELIDDSTEELTVSENGNCATMEVYSDGEMIATNEPTNVIPLLSVQPKGYVGAKVFTLSHKYVNVGEDCPVCKGNPINIIKGVTYKCAECNGSGRINEFSVLKHFVTPCEIKSIVATFLSNGISLLYSVYRNEQFVYTDESSENIFATEAEAIAECERRNNK